MLAGMGGGELPRARRGRQRGRGHRHVRRQHDEHRAAVEEIAKVESAHVQAVRRRPAHGVRRSGRGRHPGRDRRRGTHLRGRTRRAREVVDLLHSHNVLVGSMCGKVRHAVAAVASGCDFVVAQGTEAGGHTGLVATMALVPQVVDAVGDKVPVVAAGGLFDGRGLAASLALGADGVWIGTRFIATPEAQAVNGYKAGAARASPRTARSSARATPARPAGSSATTGPTTSRSNPDELQPFPSRRSCQPGRRQPSRLSRPAPRSTPNKEFMPAGQGVGAINSLIPAGDIVRRMVREAEAVIDRIAAAEGLTTGHEHHRHAATPIDTIWTDDIEPALLDYIRIPNVSEAFDAQWARARTHASRRRPDRRWCAARPIAGLTVDVHELPGRTPLIFIEIPAFDRWLRRRHRVALRTPRQAARDGRLARRTRALDTGRRGRSALRTWRRRRRVRRVRLARRHRGRAGDWHGAHPAASCSSRPARRAAAPTCPAHLDALARPHRHTVARAVPRPRLPRLRPAVGHHVAARDWSRARSRSRSCTEGVHSARPAASCRRRSGSSASCSTGSRTRHDGEILLPELHVEIPADRARRGRSATARSSANRSPSTSRSSTAPDPMVDDAGRSSCWRTPGTRR